MPDIMDVPGIGFRVGRTEAFKEAEHPFLECPTEGELRLAHASLSLDTDQGLRIKSRLSLQPDGRALQMYVPGGLSIQAGGAAVPALTVSDGGDVTIGSAAASRDLHVTGNLHVEGQIRLSEKGRIVVAQARDGETITVPWGKRDDWSIILVPQSFGYEEKEPERASHPEWEVDNALICYECKPVTVDQDDRSWRVVARYRFYYRREAAAIQWSDTFQPMPGTEGWFKGRPVIPGNVTYILVPK